MNNKDNKQPWYVVYTKSRFENVVNENLIKKSIDSFLPKILTKSKRRDRKKNILIPLFPSYVFVKSDLNTVAHIEILKTTGIVNFIKNKDGPVTVASETIESLRIMISVKNQKLYTGGQFKKGNPVVVVYGPFAGVNGYFYQYKGKDRVLVNIDALGQFAAVDIHKEDVALYYRYKKNDS